MTINEAQLPVLVQAWLTMQRAQYPHEDPEDQLYRYNWLVEVSAERPTGIVHAHEGIEFYRWCTENVSGLWSHHFSTFGGCFLFSDRSDSLRFILTFRGSLVDLRPYLNPHPSAERGNSI